MSLTELNPKQMGYGKTQIRPKQIMDHNNSITYTPHSTGALVISSGTTAHSSGFIQMSHPLTLKDIQRFRKEVKDLPHPCLSFFLKCFNQDSTVIPFYDGNHVVCESNGILFDDSQFFSEDQTMKVRETLKESGLVHILTSFHQLTLDEIQILIRYFKQ